ncbi:hypothetical protein [Streptomyces lavendulae]|uniref:hypothetical protein n=1 Tax=Streptomyces lavendulae TaxID=1914 RepID=UPI0037FBE578
MTPSDNAPEFIFKDFRPEQIAVNRTQPVKLHWVCEGDEAATFTLFWTGNPDGEAIGAGIREWPPADQTHTIANDTNFMLRANTRNPDDTEEHHYLTTGISCIDPDLKANTLNVANITDLNGACRVNGPVSLNGTTTTRNLTTNGVLTVAGVTNLGSTNINSGNILKVNEIQANGSPYGVHVNADLQLKGNLGRWGGSNAGPITLANAGLTIPSDQTFTAEGPINLNGPLGSGAQSGSLAINTTKSFTAPTSGILVGHAYSGSRYSGVKVSIWGVSGPSPHTVATTATAAQTSNNSSLTQHSGVSAVVRKGDDVSLRAEALPNSANPPSYLNAWWVWYPFGDSWDLLFTDSDDTAPDLDVVDPPSEGSEEI